MKAYRIPQTRVVYEILSTEVIVVDFTTGNYYALIHVARQIWQLIEQRASVDQMAQLLSNRYQRENLTVLQDLRQFLEELLENQLIESTDQGENPEATLPPSEGWKYDIPKLQKYTDVQSLLLLDPIHEVAEAGWPAKVE
ncbi:MAG TPA: PqqD family protein [Chlamydiales bacterium]|jgi:hypothetical protein|nr:PqqD family protein [Chlamydiales bacterium]